MKRYTDLMNNLHQAMTEIGERAQKASRALLGVSTRCKNKILEQMAVALEEQRAAILSANAEDVSVARTAGLSDAMLDRLTLTAARFDTMVSGFRDVAALPDPVGKTIWRRKRPNGLIITKRREPLGVIAIIFESRPNVTADVTALCIKTSNAVILRGGKESIRSNRAIAEALRSGGSAAGLPEDAVQLIRTTEHAAVTELVQLEGLVDVVIPRGGERLIRAVMDVARVPVLKHYKGVCHMYVDDAANIDMALSILTNAKTQRPSACNAVETVLVHAAIADVFLPKLIVWAHQAGVTLHTTDESPDWTREYLSLELAVRVVTDIHAAIAHINQFGSHHSDAIITESTCHATEFLRDVDSAAVYHNASTRFTDGGAFGMGAEMGISTDKLHARGPMGLEELTTYKYVVRGGGQIRD